MMKALLVLGFLVSGVAANAGELQCHVSWAYEGKTGGFDRKNIRTGTEKKSPRIEKQYVRQDGGNGDILVFDRKSLDINSLEAAFYGDGKSEGFLSVRFAFNRSKKNKSVDYTVSFSSHKYSDSFADAPLEHADASGSFVRSESEENDIEINLPQSGSRSGGKLTCKYYEMPSEE